MECVVCKEKGVETVEVEGLSEEIALCETCLGDFENGELDGALTVLLAKDD